MERDLIMQNYSYTAKDDHGKQVRGTMTADSEIDLANKIGNLGFYLIYSKITAEEHAQVKSSLSGLKLKEVLNLTFHLSTLLDAGVPLVGALRELSEDEEKVNIKKIVDDVRYRVESGASLKDALSYHPSSFPKLFTAIVGAGENTGKLPAALKELAALLSWQIELGAKVKEAATYPIILFTVMLGVVTLLVVKMIPTFEPIFKDLRVDLPLPTQIVLSVSHSVRQGWYIIVGGIVALAAAYKFYNSTANGRYVLDSIKLKLPVFGPLTQKIALSRFCHTFSLGLRSGVNILTALDFAADVVGNMRLKRSVLKARDSVNVGEKLAASFKSSGDFPPLVVRMIGVGEQSGSLTQTLEKVNEYYDREVPATIRAMFALFEPVMIVIMAVIVGGIAVAIFLPLFKMAEVIGG
jgi:type IV pilus assembly protein PilC